MSAEPLLTSAEPLLTSEDLAARFPGTTAQWFDRAAREGKFPHVKVGRHTFFTEDDVATFIAANHKRAQSGSSKGWGQKRKAS